MKTEEDEKTESTEVEGSGASVVVSPTTPTPGDDNPVFAIPRIEVSD